MLSLARVRAPAVFAVAVGLAGCARHAEPPPPRAVHVVTVIPRGAEALSRYSGSLAPWEQIELSFAVPGRVRSVATIDEAGKERSLQEGDPVRRGDVLAALDDADFRRKARAASATMQSAAAQLGAAETSLAQATTEVERARRLRATDTIPQAELERAEATFTRARSNVDVARAQQLAAAEQNALARSAVADARIVSPIDGVLARRLVDVGEAVAPGMAAFTVIDVTRLRVVFAVPGHQVAAMTLGRKLPVRVEGLLGEAIIGTVSKVLPVADAVLHSFAVEVTIPNPDDALRPGMVASIATGADASGGTSGGTGSGMGSGTGAPETLLVPIEAVVRASSSPAGTAGGFAVWVVPAGRKAVTQRPVELGDLHGNDVSVRAGLLPGEIVVSRGAQLLREGELVEVTQ